MKTDAEIVRLFADSNPLPVGSDVPRPADLIDLRAMRERTIDMTKLEQAPEVRETASRRWRWIAAAALAAVVLLVIVMALRPTSSDVIDPVPATTISPTTTGTTPVPTADPLGVAEGFLDARNQFDATAALQFVSASATELDGIPIGDVGQQYAWYEMFDWSYQGIECTSVDLSNSTEVTCSYNVENRLSRYRGIEHTGTSFFVVVDGEITLLRVERDISEYSRRAFGPFSSWVAATRPGEAQLLWGFDPGFEIQLSDEAIAAFDAALTEYTASPEPPLALNQAFMEAVAARDADALQPLLASDATISDLWVTAPDEYAGLFAFFEATDWDTELHGCGIARAGTDATPLLLGCGYSATSAFEGAGASPINEREMEFTVSDGQITNVENGLALGTLEFELRAWVTWLEETYPADHAVMYESVAGRSIPQFTPEALALFPTRLAEYAEVDSG